MFIANEAITREIYIVTRVLDELRQYTSGLHKKKIKDFKFLSVCLGLFIPF